MCKGFFAVSYGSRIPTMALVSLLVLLLPMNPATPGQLSYVTLAKLNCLGAL